MSIDLDPALYDYEDPPNVCPAIFGADLTPDTLFLIFNGIKKGAIWVAADGLPPNGIWAIIPTEPCLYNDTVDGHVVEYDTKFFGSSVHISTPRPTGAFLGQMAFPGKTWFANVWDVPAGNEFYGGFCSVTSAITSDQKNLQDIWNSLGEIREAGTYVTPRPKSATETVHTISKRIDHTNIKIVFDDS